jgi:hypothetical protein
VLLAVAANRVIRREHGQDVLVEFLDRGRGEPAEAREGLPFVMDLAIIADQVIGREGGVEVIGDSLVSAFRETTRATHGSHVSTFP